MKTGSFNKMVLNTIIKKIQSDIEKYSKSSWNSKRIAEKKYGNIGILVSDIVKKTPRPVGVNKSNLRLAISDSICELCDDSLFIEKINGKHGEFITLTDDKILSYIDMHKDAIKDNSKSKYNRLFWRHSTLRRDDRFVV